MTLKIEHNLNFDIFCISTSLQARVLRDIFSLRFYYPLSVASHTLQYRFRIIVNALETIKSDDEAAEYTGKEGLENMPPLYNEGAAYRNIHVMRSMGFINERPTADDALDAVDALWNVKLTRPAASSCHR